jgi:hypothetical protein
MKRAAIDHTATITLWRNGLKKQDKMANGFLLPIWL